MKRQLRDIKALLPAWDVQIVVDVGAHRGNTVARLREAWPLSRIYTIEPHPDNFRRLAARFDNDARVVLQHGALGARHCAAYLEPGVTHTRHYIVNTPSTTAYDVNMTTLDRFCRRHGIDRVNYLKIDTEGLDLEVLRGAKRLLAEGRIDIIQVECTPSSGKSMFAPLHVIDEYLSEFVLFGLYDLHRSREDPARLRRCDAIFVQHELAAAAKVV